MSYSFQKVYTLKAQTPLIHFQPNMTGATLRATEVKPKLDRYIKNRLAKENRKLPKEWLIKKPEEDKKAENQNNEDKPKKNTALDYKMSIQRIGTNIEPIPLGRYTDYDIFYGNTGVDEDNQKQGIKADCKLTITCFKEDLFSYIKQNINEFFFVTNFGTMQNKGFGSFTVDGKFKFNSQGICQMLKTEYSSEHCYYFTVNNSDNIFKAIKCIYSLMKSGVNYGSYGHSILFDYVTDSNKMGQRSLINNEKAWLKQQEIAPNIGNHRPNYNRIDSNSRYVRALFGISDSMSFKRTKDGDNDFIVKRTETSETIERLNSPVFFKVIGKTVYYVGMPINEEIYGKTFNFSSEWNEDGMEIVVPQKEELPDNFMNDFMQYVCKKINNCKSRFGDIDMRNIKIVEF